MKVFKHILILLVAGFIISSCSLQEDPTFLSQESAFANLGNARSTLDGVYNGMAAYHYFGNDFLYLSFGSSGYFVSGAGGSSQSTDNKFLCSLKPQPSATYTENTWQGMYLVIERANTIIANMDVVDNPQDAEEFGWNDVIGEAYFLRAFTYFNLVRLWGDIPLRLEPTDATNINKPKSSTEVVYSQILADADMAKKLMFPKGLERSGYPAAEAAAMLKAKVYMQMATTDDKVPAGDNFWQMAYNEAKEVYGKYSLVNNYADLFKEQQGNNTVESIFEIQFNDIASSNYVKFFTAPKATKGKTWGRIKFNAELIDYHMAAYPDDSIRLTQTYKTSYVKMNNMKTVKLYPENSTRKNFASAFPFEFKYWEKNANNAANYNFQNFIVYRYADLLLMLAEISNELQNGEQMTYLTEVLDRVGLNPRPEYSQGQEAFREAVMEEYRYELVGEAHDWFNNRRRGYEYFKNHVIIPHNTSPVFKEAVDVTLADDKDVVMHIPIPTSEINTNEDIDN